MMYDLLRLFLLVVLLVGTTHVAAHAQPAAAPDGLAAVQPTDAPTDPVLSHAYPNPFTAHTSFELSVPKAQLVKVEVFNMLGQRVRTLYDGPMEAGETVRLTFQADALPPGIYLYRASSATFTATRRVMLVE